MLRWFIEMNFSALIVIISMTVFLTTNSILRKDVNRTFGLSLVLTTVEMIVYCAELWLADHGGPAKLCILYCALGYVIRPIIIYLFVKLSLHIDRKKHTEHFLILLPILLNVLASFSAFFTDIVYTYNSESVFIRGPLGYFAHAVCITYLAILLILTIKRFCSRDYSEGIIIFLVVSINVIAMMIESLTELYGTGRTAYSLSIVFYYLFFCVESFKRDSLTGALNRRCFYIDSEKHKAELTAVVSIDMNGLKKINDIQGHAKGDEAICATVNAIDKVVPKGCSLYRMGGDEFMILCTKTEREAVKKMIEQIRAEMEKTPFTCAVGAAYINGDDFDGVCAQADAEMYKDKQKYKALCAT